MTILAPGIVWEREVPAGIAWTQDEIEAFGHGFAIASGLAVDWLDDNAIASMEKREVGLRKVLSLTQARVIGQCHDKNYLSIYTDREWILRGRQADAAFLEMYATTTIHETVHCIREERRPRPETFYTIPGLLERAATEGLATYAEKEFGTGYFGALEETHADRILQQVSPEDRDDLVDYFIAEVSGEKANQQGNYDSWFVNTNLGYLVGLHSVNKIVQEGMALDDALSLPAEVIVGGDSSETAT